MNTHESKSFHFKNLDSIRTIAFFSIFLAHAFYTESPMVENSAAFQWAVKFRDIFSFGVPIFFVLSGFLISFLMLREQQTHGVFSIKNFYVRRVLRIWPVYFMVLVFGFVIFPIIRTSVLRQPYHETASPWMYALFLSNFDQINAGALPFGAGLGPTWSVSVEEQFYLFWPVMLLLFKDRMFLFPVLVVMACAIFFSAYLNLSRKHTLHCLIYLSTGALFAYLSIYREKWIRNATAVSPVYLLLAIAGIVAGIHASSHAIAPYVAIAFLIGYVIIYQCYGSRLNFGSIPFLERFGKYTYGLYLYHVICNLFAHVLVDDILRWQDSVATAVFIKPIVSLTLSLVLSYLSYRYVESYFLGLKERFNKPRAQNVDRAVTAAIQVG
jgi:peptidoglycan/LPS O-acetylase OafA/YrhL